MGTRLWMLSVLALAGCPADPGETDCTPQTFYEDIDGDGFGTEAISACVQPPDSALEGGDCDDLDGLVNPGAEERCNGEDDDCDGFPGEEESDDDQDGAPFCDDCDDDDPDVYPGAPERCNGLDDDCDLEIDEEGPESRTFFRDDDGDGFGQTAEVRRLCAADPGWVEDGGDCDDVDPFKNPGVAERCDDVDWNCDGTAGTGWEVADELELLTAVESAEPGATLCMQAGRYAIDLDVPTHLTLEGVGEVTVEPARSSRPALHWVESETPGSPWGLANMTLRSDAARQDLMTLTGAPTPMHGRDLRITSADGSCARIEAPRGRWTGVEIDHLTCVDQSRPIETALDLVDLDLHDIETRVESRGVDSVFLEARSFDGARVRALRIGSSGDGAREWGEEPIQLTELVDTVVSDVDIDLSENLEWAYREGGLIAAAKASNVEFSNITVRGYWLRGALLQSPTIEGLVVRDIDAELGLDLEGLVHTSTASDVRVSDVRVRAARRVLGGVLSGDGDRTAPTVTGLSGSRIDVAAGQELWGGVLYSFEGDWTVQDVDIRTLRAEAPEVRGGVFSFYGGALSHAVLADIDVVGGAVTGLMYGRGPGQVSFATWRDIQVTSRQKLRLIGHDGCAVDHLDLSASTVRMESACAFSYTNLHDVVGLDIAATELRPTYVDVSSDDATLWDLHPAGDSPLVDAGDPMVLESDGSAADISAYGGR